MCYCFGLLVVFFTQKTAYEMRISDWSSDVCSSDLAVDRNVSTGKLGSHCLRHTHQASLGRGIIGLPRIARCTNNRSDRDDAAKACLHHRLACRASKAE